MGYRSEYDKQWSLAFGINLQRMLRIHNVSQGELAKKLGITETMLSRYIHGTSTPSVSKVSQMASIIGCDISDLIKTEYKL